MYSSGSAAEKQYLMALSAHRRVHKNTRAALCRQKCNNNIHTTLTRVVANTRGTERFMWSFRNGGLILLLPLESQQVAVLINGA